MSPQKSRGVISGERGGQEIEKKILDIWNSYSVTSCIQKITPWIITFTVWFNWAIPSILQRVST